MSSTQPSSAVPGDANLAKLPVDQLRRQLGVSAEGLTREEAQERLTRYGYNELPEEKVNPLLKFLSYFWGPIPWMIETAAILSAAVGTGPISPSFSCCCWATPSSDSGRSIRPATPSPPCGKGWPCGRSVKRGGVWATIAARELVPGDVVRLRIGDIVPADAKLLDGDPIEVDQSALTGESLPVTRKTDDVVYSGSIVRQGEIDALVYATGGQTYFGKTAHLVEATHTVSHFQRAVLKIGDFLIVLAVALVALIVVVALFRGDPMLQPWTARSRCCCSR